MRQSTQTWTLLLIFLFAFPGASFGSGNRRVPLRQTATAAEDTLSLDDLLPEAAPGWLRARAAGIGLGTAPQLGALRVFQHTQLEDDLRNMPQILSAIEIPDTIVVRRAERYLTADEILQAVRESLASKLSGKRLDLSADDLMLTSPVAVASDHPGLRVTRIESDPTHGITRFRLLASSEPHIHPFWVAAQILLDHEVIVAAHSLAAGAEIQDADLRMEKRMGPVDSFGAKDPSIANLVGRRLLRPIRAGGSIDESALEPLFLVLPGETSTVLLQGAGFRIVTHGTPLQKGIRGQEIRIRTAETGKVIVAKVVAKQYLEAEF